LGISNCLPSVAKLEIREYPLSQRRKSQRQQQSLQVAVQRAVAGRDDKLAQLAERVAQLEQRVGVSQLNTELAEAERRWQAERQRLVDELERTSELLRQAQEELGADRREVSEPRERLEEQFDPISSDEEEVFARLRAMSLLKESADAPQEDRFEAGTYESDDLTGQQLRRKTDIGGDRDEPPEDDTSIDDYMARLLDRARGAVVSEVRQGAEAAPAGERSFVRAEPVKMEPRAKAPEASIGLAVMREIANQSARAAISTHHVRHRETHARRMKDFSMVAAAIAALLLCLAEALGRPLLIAGLIAAMVSVWSFVRTAIRQRRSRLSGTDREEPFDEAEEEAAGAEAAGDQASQVDSHGIDQPDACSPAVKTATSQ
jgi:hypothetical protein